MTNHRFGAKTTISQLMAQRSVLWRRQSAAMTDSERDAHCGQLGAIEEQILASPALSADDLASKFSVWLELIKDPPSILDHHVESFRTLWGDVAVEASIPVKLGAMAAAYPKRRVAS